VIDEHIEEQASLYVLGLLSPDEAREFEAAMAADPEIAELAQGAERGAAALAWTVPPRQPPKAIRSRIEDAIRRDARQTERKVSPAEIAFNWFPWALAACLALMLGVFAYKRFQNRLVIADFIIRERDQQAEVDRVQRQEVALEGRLQDAIRQNADLLAQVDTARGQLAELKARSALSDVKIAMLASMAKNAPEARAVVAWDGNSQQGIVKTLGMPAAGADQDYELWVFDSSYKAPVAAGVFNPDTGSNFAPIHRIMKADKFAITLEKKGGSDLPHGPVVMVSE
jgi:anti-sigma-K factor RskA